MGRELRRISERRKALQRIYRITDSPEDVLLIHYSCESFYEIKDGRTPRVTSIAIRNLESGQTESFSIHKVAEQQQVPMEDISNSYNELEKTMLAEYFEFLHLNQSRTWVHWNMRDINYGFQAIEHRFKALGGEPVALPEGKKLDLARALISIYGVQYAPHPRIEKLIGMNHISNRSFLTGKEEADAFDTHEYVKLHQSTLRKVDIFDNILERTANNTLKTNARWYEIYGIHPKVAVELVTKHWLVSAFSFIALILGLLKQIGVV